MFATANLQKIQVNFLFDNQPLLGYQTVSTTDSSGKTIEQEVPRKVPLFILIFGTFGLGFLVSGMLTTGLLRNQKKKNKKLKKENEALTRELNELRNLPVQGGPKSEKDTDSLPERSSQSLPIK
jgi:hypothetical protein